MVDLKAFTARGFPGKWDEALANTPVAGVDRAQCRNAVRLCAETEPILYGPDFSPTRLRYRQGSRPMLERITGELWGSTPSESARAAMAWTRRNVVHAHLAGPLAPDRGFTEERIIESAVGWCNEQVRVFIALCEVMGVPARVCFLFHANELCGHSAAEAYVAGRWAFFDVTFEVAVALPGGRLAEGRELSGPHRALAHQAYRRPLEEHYSRVLPFAEDCPGWREGERPTIDRGADLLETIGLCNYVIDGVEAL